MIARDQYHHARAVCIGHAAECIARQIMSRTPGEQRPAWIPRGIRTTLEETQEWPGIDGTPEWRAYLDDLEARVGLDVAEARAFATLAHAPAEEFEDLWQSVVAGYGSPFES